LRGFSELEFGTIFEYRRSNERILNAMPPSVELVDLQMLPRKDPEAIEIAPNANSLDLLQAVYRNNDLPLHTRMRAAMAALKHEVPALLASAIINESSFAELLERRLKRLDEMKLIEAKEDTNGNSAAIKGDTNRSKANANGGNIADTATPAPSPNPLMTRVYSNKFRRRF